MKTLTTFLIPMIVAAIIAIGAAFIVVGLTYAQEETVAVTSQLLHRQALPDAVTEDDDDLYALLRGDADSIAKGPRRTAASRATESEEKVNEGQKLEQDLWMDPVEKLFEVVNPDSYTVDSIYIDEDGNILINFMLQYCDIISIRVDSLTGIADFVDTQLEESLIRIRTMAAYSLGMEMKDVHINLIGYGGLPYPATLLSAIVEAGDYTMILEYAGPESYSRLFLRSLIYQGRDYVAEMVGVISGTLNSTNLSVGVDFWQITDGILTLNIRLFDASYYARYSFPVSIDIATGQIVMDWELIDNIMALREEVARNIAFTIRGLLLDGHLDSGGYLDYDIYFYAADISEVGVEGVWASSSGRTLILLGTSRFLIGYEYDPESRSFFLVSLTNRSSGIELYAGAVSMLKETVNPDYFVLDSWNFGFGNSIVFNFRLAPNDPSYPLRFFGVSIAVDIVTGNVSMCNWLDEATIRAARGSMASLMGVSIDDIHINDAIMDLGLSYWWWSVTNYTITARVGEYIIVSDYLVAGQPYIIWDPGSVFSPSFCLLSTSLRSFVDATTGADYVAETFDNMQELLNPEFGGFRVESWRMEGGSLILNIGLYFEYDPMFPAWGNIPVTVNLNTGEVSIDQHVINAVEYSRWGVSNTLNIAIEDVHINQLWHVNSTNDYEIFIVASGFAVGFSYDGETDTTKLVSLMNRETGADIYGNAVSYIRGLFGERDYVLDQWCFADSSQTMIRFWFQFSYGGQIYLAGVDVNIYTGESGIGDIYIYNAQEKRVLTDKALKDLLAIFAKENADSDQASGSSAATQSTVNSSDQSQQCSSSQWGSGNGEMPDWIKELLNQILEKNAAHSGGGSKNVHTYDQMATASQSSGLPLRWKRR